MKELYEQKKKTQTTRPHETDATNSAAGATSDAGLKGLELPKLWVAGSERCSEHSP